MRPEVGQVWARPSMTRRITKIETNDRGGYFVTVAEWETDRPGVVHLAVQTLSGAMWAHWVRHAKLREPL